MPQLTVDTGMNTKPILKGASELNSAIRSLQGAVSRVGKDLDASVVGYAKAMENNAAATRNFNNQISALKDAADILRYQLTSLASIRVPNPEFKQLEQEIKAVSKEYEQLDKADSKFMNSGVGVLMKQWDNYQKRIEANREAAEKFVTTLAAMKSELTGINNAINTGKKSDGTMLSPDELKAAKKRRTQLMNDIWMGETLPPQEYQTYENAQKNIARMVKDGDDKIIEEFKRNSEKLKEASDRRRELLAKRDQMRQSGQDTVSGATTQEYKDVEEQLKQVNKQIEVTKKQAEEALKPQFLKEWERMPTFTQAVAEGFARIQNAASIAGLAMQRPLQALDRLIPVAVSGLANLAQRAVETGAKLGRMAGNAILSGIRQIGRAAINAATGLARMTGSTVVSFLRRLADGAKKAAVQLAKVAGSAIIGGLRKIGSLAAAAGKSLLGLGKSAKRSNGSIKEAITMLVRYGFGVRSVYMLVRKLRSAIVDAFQNMAKKVPEVNKTISALASSMDLLKNSLATAFQPILTAIAPYLVQLMDMMSEAAAKVGEFFAVLTGQNYIYQATKANIDYAKSLDKSTKSTKKNTKETENQLASFDHLNILKENKDTGSSSDSDKNETPTADFKKVPIESAISDLAKRIKDAFSKGDFTEIGKILANKLTEWVNEINWAWLGKKIGEGINHIVDVVNGFFDNFDWVDLGQKFAEGLNSLIDNVNFYELGRAMTQKLRALIETAWGVVSDINWEHVGDAIGNYIQGAFDNIPWETLGETVGTAITGVFRALQNAIVSFGWADAGERLANALNSMFDSINWVQMGNTINALFKGVLKGLKTFIATFDWDSHAKELERGFKNFIKKLPTADIGEVLKNATIKIIRFIRKGLIDKDTWGQAGTKFGELLNKLFETDGKGNTIWTELALAVGDLAESVVTAISATVNEFEWGDAGQNFHDAILLLVEKFPLDELGSGLSDLMAGALGFLNETLGDERLFNQLGTDTADFFNKFTGNTALWDEIGEGVNNAFLGVLEFGQSFIDGFKEDDAANAIKTAIGKIDFGDIATKTWNLLKSAFAKAGSFVDALFSESLDNTRAQIDPAYVEKVANFNNQSVGARIGAKISEALSKIPWKSIGETVWSAAKTAFSNAGDFLVAIFGITDEDIAATKSKSKIEAIATKIGNELGKIPWATILGTVKDKFLVAFQEIVDGLANSESGDGSILLAIGGAIAGLKIGIPLLLKGLTTTLSGSIMTSGLLLMDVALIAFDISKITQIANGFADVVTAHKDRIKNALDTYARYIESGNKDTADQFAELVAGIDTTNMNADQAMQELKTALVKDAQDTYGVFIDNLETGNDELIEVAQERAANAQASTETAYLQAGQSVADSYYAGLKQRIFQIDDISPEVASALTTILEAADSETSGRGEAEQFYSGFKNTVFDKNGEVKDEFVGVLNDIFMEGDLESIQKGKMSADDFVQAFNDGTRTVGGDATEQLRQFFEIVFNGQDTKTPATNLANDATDTFTSGINTKEEEVKKAYEGTFVKTYEDSVEGANGFDIGSGKSSRTGKLGIAAVRNLSEGMDSENGTLQRSLKGIVDTSNSSWGNVEEGQSQKLGAMSSNLSSIMGQMTSTSENETGNQAKPVYDNYGEIMVAVDECMRAARDYLAQYAGEMTTDLSNEMNAMGRLRWYDIGNGIVQGIANGVNNGWNWLNNTVWNLANSLFQSAKNALGIHSPSRVFRDGIGENIGLGIAEGILDTQSDVMDSVASLADIASEKMNETDLGDFVNADGAGLVDGLDSVLDVFSNRVQNSFSDMLSKLNAIANTVTFRTPAIATGTVLPYAVSGGQTGGSKSVSDVVAKTNDEQTSALIQAFNNQTVAIVRAIEQYSTTNVNIDKKSFTDAIIEEINRRTRAAGSSPLLI